MGLAGRNYLDENSSQEKMYKADADDELGKRRIRKKREVGADAQAVVDGCHQVQIKNLPRWEQADFQQRLFYFII
jgi:hypothetical protein